MKKKLKYYGGQGYGQSYEIGVYEVKYKETSKKFGKLSEARKFYNELNEGKALWQHKPVELLEAHL